MLLTNSKGGAPEPTPFQLQLRKRKRSDSGEEEESDVECEVEHQIMSITQYLNAKDSGSKASKRNSLAGEPPAKRRNSEELAKEHRQYMGLLCVARCAQNQPQMQTSAVFSVPMKWMGVYLVSVGPNQAEYAAKFIKNECGQLNYVFKVLCFAV